MCAVKLYDSCKVYLFDVAVKSTSSRSLSFKKKFTKKYKLFKTLY